MAAPEKTSEYAICNWCAMAAPEDMPETVMRFPSIFRAPVGLSAMAVDASIKKAVVINVRMSFSNQLVLSSNA